MHLMKIEELISPLDNRYSLKIKDLANNFSESNLNKIRFEIEIEWLIFLCTHGGKNFKPLSASAKNNLFKIKNSFNLKSSKRIKSIESRTNHDVKQLNILLEKK